MSELDRVAEQILLADIRHRGIHHRSGYQAVLLAEEFLQSLAAHKKGVTGEETQQKTEQQGLTDEEILAIKDGNVIHALKLVRERLRFSHLKTAKEFIDHERAKLKI